MPVRVKLLTQVETAVRTGDRVRSFELAPQIQHQLVSIQHAYAARELLAELNRPAPQVQVLDAGTKLVERTFALAANDGVVYPVWFGTNRRPRPNSIA